MQEPNHTSPAPQAPQAAPAPQGTPVTLSSLTKALLLTLKAYKPPHILDESQQVQVSQTVAFFAFVYEKVRAAMEYLEEHLVTRFAIERILRRRFALNPSGEGEAEQLVRELMWARYFPNGSIHKGDIAVIQTIIDRFLWIKKQALEGKDEEAKKLIAEMIEDLMTAEIEEHLNPAKAHKSNTYTFYVFQVLSKKLKIENVGEDLKDAYLFAAIEEGFAKNNPPYIRYHLWRLWNEPIHTYTHEELEHMAKDFFITLKKIELIMGNPYRNQLVRFVTRQAPPFKIIMELVNKKKLTDPDTQYIKEDLVHDIVTICNEKYALTRKKLQATGWRSLIYIALTKAAFAFFLEGPVNAALFNETDKLPIIINSVFPVALMAFILLLVTPPGKDNTQKMVERVLYLLTSPIDGSNPTVLTTSSLTRRPILEGVFTGLYISAFFGFFMYVSSILSNLHFNFISQGVFLFFTCVVSYFAFRTTQIAEEYKIGGSGHFFTPLIDFIFMPFLRVGKYLSGQLSKLNIFVYLLDFLIEAPFKFVFDVVEEWTRFVRKKKEEIL